MVFASALSQLFPLVLWSLSRRWSQIVPFFLPTDERADPNIPSLDYHPPVALTRNASFCSDIARPRGYLNCFLASFACNFAQHISWSARSSR
ncbi:hypothetical protein B0H14DRAFT_2713680, partial [Mycena olivaceomarginata]